VVVKHLDFQWFIQLLFFSDKFILTFFGFFLISLLCKRTINQPGINARGTLATAVKLNLLITMSENLKISEKFSGVIGQTKAKQLISMLFSSLENGSPASPLFLRGQSGLGKTRILDVVEEMYRDNGWNVIRINCPSEIVGEKYGEICGEVRESLAPLAFVIDESHRLKKGRVSITRFHKFVQLATDERMVGRQISINDGELSTVVNRHKLAFCLASNFASELEEMRGSTSFLGRFHDVLLEDYSRAESDEILDGMIHAKKLNIADSTRGYIASCARGNARPLQQITDKLAALSSSIGGKTTLNREHVMHAIRLSDMFPAGLDRSEIEIMQCCAARPMRQNILVTQFPNIDRKQFGNSLAYLQRPDRDFVRMTTKGFLTTPDGVRYLKESAKLGFQVERKN